MAGEGATLENEAFYNQMFMLLPVNVSDRNCWQFFILYFICINLFKIMNLWDWCAFILVHISSFIHEI